MVGENGPCEVLYCRKPAALDGGNNVDIVGVPSSILGTPTIQINDLAGDCVVGGRFDKPETPVFPYRLVTSGNAIRRVKG